MSAQVLQAVGQIQRCRGPGVASLSACSMMTTSRSCRFSASSFFQFHAPGRAVEVLGQADAEPAVPVDTFSLGHLDGPQTSG